MQRKNGKTNGKTREIWGREFRVVKQGLDEREVFSFVGGLIDRNNEYAEKLDHLDSLVKLGESTIIEADQEADRIRLQAHETAGEEAEAILTRADEEARTRADRTLAEAEESAAQHAGHILSVATETAQQKVAAAQQLAQEIIESAESDAKQQTKAIREKTTEQVRATREKARQILTRSRDVAVSDITAKFEAAYREMIMAWVAADDHVEPGSVSAADQGVAESPNSSLPNKKESQTRPSRPTRSIRRTIFGGKRT